jgi:peptidoglycan/xylan/chitin deacetylase (PgdA/CDA1 family)
VIDKHTCKVRNYNRKHIEKDYFAFLLKRLKKVGVALSMDEVIDFHDRGESYPAFSFAVTFDDGFENNISVAAPILADLRIPATFYVTSGFIELNSMSWIDRIEFMLEEVPRGKLKLPWHDKASVFSSTSSRINLLNEIRSNVKVSPQINTDDLVQEIGNQLKLPTPTSSDHVLDLKMNWSQVKELGSQDHFIIGGHTHTHPILSFLSAESLRVELDTSLELLRDRTGVETVHYAYPEGLQHCYNSLVISELKSRGIKCCPSAIPGKNTLEQDLFNLRRTLTI